MLKDYKPSGYFAHPGEHLSTHLSFVATENQKIGENYHLEGKNLEKFFALIGLLHDLGKYTKIFQYYISELNKNNIDGETFSFIQNYKEHSIFGAFFCFYIIGRNLPVLNKKGFTRKEADLLTIAGTYAILKHHGNLENIEDIQDSVWLEEKIEIVQTQLEYTDFDFLNNEIKSLFENYDIEFIFDFNEFYKLVNNGNFGSHFEKFMENALDSIEEDNQKIQYIRIFYSSLIYADKYKTIFQDKQFQKNQLNNPYLVENYKEFCNMNNPTDKFNLLRDEIYKNVTKNLERINLENHFYTLNAPTGAGKTFNLLNIALNIQSKLQEQGKNSKIVYGLPFTSIIDQVHQEVYNILEINGYNPEDDNLLLKHHYLSEINFDDESENLLENYDKKKFMINSWDSSMIITTFVQIFHTIFGNKNKWLIKYPNFQNTVFILDEIQTTPYWYWGNFREMFRILAKEMNCYFVLSSATLPMIFEKNESVELLPNNQKYFDQLDRTSIDISNISNALGIEDFCEDIKTSLDENLDKHHLIILNTIKSSLKVYKALKDIYNDENNEIVYLSTNIIPAHRKERIKKIKNLKNSASGKRVIVVCTQLIEAGVDIDMNIGFRDVGPIDSIVQALGRINRSGKNPEKGILYLYSLVDEDNKKQKKFANYIYDYLSLQFTDSVLNGKSVINEKDYKYLFDRCFELIQQNKGKDTENKLLENWNKLDFYEMDKNFKLIENTYQTVDIFVNIDEESQNILNEFQKISNISNKWERKKKWDRIKGQFLQYVISPARDKVKNCGFDEKQLERGLVIMDNYFINKYYDKNIGFIVESKDDDVLEDNFI